MKEKSDQNMAKYTKGGVLMEYSTPSADEGGTEATEQVLSIENPMDLSNPMVLSNPAITQAIPFKDDDNIRLSDLPENYFDDLLEMDFYNEKPQKKQNEVKLLISGFKMIKDEKLDLIEKDGQKSKDHNLEIEGFKSDKERIRITFNKDKKRDVGKTTIPDSESTTLNNLKRHRSTSPTETKTEKQTKLPETIKIIETVSLEEPNKLQKEETESTHQVGLTIPVIQPGSIRMLTSAKAQGLSATENNSGSELHSIPATFPQHTYPSWPQNYPQHSMLSNPSVQPLPVTMSAPMITTLAPRPEFYVPSQLPNFAALQQQQPHPQIEYDPMSTVWPFPQPPQPGKSTTSSPLKSQPRVKNKVSPIHGVGRGGRILAFVQKVKNPATVQNAGSTFPCTKKQLKKKQGSQLDSNLGTSEKILSNASAKLPTPILQQKQEIKAAKTSSEGTPEQSSDKILPHAPTTNKNKVCSIGTKTEQVSKVSTTAKKQQSIGVQCQMECSSCGDKEKIISRLKKLVDEVKNPLLRQTMKSLLDFNNVQKTSSGKSCLPSTIKPENQKKASSPANEHFNQETDTVCSKEPLSKETIPELNGAPKCLSLNKTDCKVSVEEKCQDVLKLEQPNLSSTSQNVPASGSTNSSDKRTSLIKLSLQDAQQSKKVPLHSNLPKQNFAKNSKLNSNSTATLAKILKPNLNLSSINLQKCTKPLVIAEAKIQPGGIGSKKALLKADVSNSIDTKTVQKNTTTPQNLDSSQKSQLTLKKTASNILKPQKEQHINLELKEPTDLTDSTSTLGEEKLSASVKKDAVNGNKNQELSSMPKISTDCEKSAEMSTKFKTQTKSQGDVMVKDSLVTKEKTKNTMPPQTSAARGRGFSSFVPRGRGAAFPLGKYPRGRKWNNYDYSRYYSENSNGTEFKNQHFRDSAEENEDFTSDDPPLPQYNDNHQNFNPRHSFNQERHFNPGPTGPSSRRMPRFNQGPPGPHFNQGPIGPQFNQDHPGPNFDEGPHFEEGPCGPNFDQGPCGPNFDQGPPGPHFEEGPCGPNFEEGPCGPNFDQGPPGPHFEEGPCGPNFEEGPCGPNFDQGPCGPNFNQGPPGPHFEEGPCGPNFEEGPCGPNFDQGPCGPNFDQGPPGPHFEEGPCGPNFEEGPCGPNFDQGPCGPNFDQGPPGPHFNQGPFGQDSHNFQYNQGPPFNPDAPCNNVGFNRGRPNMPQRGFGNRRFRGRGFRRPFFRGRGPFNAPNNPNFGIHNN